MTYRTCPHCLLDIVSRYYDRHVAAPHTVACTACGRLCMPHVNTRCADVRKHLRDIHGIVITGRAYGEAMPL